MSYSDEMEAIEQERWAADCEQADLESLGRQNSRAHRLSGRYAESGDFARAAAVCPHGSGYPLNSLAASNDNDPREGQTGFRCTDCGSVLSADPFDFDFEVLFPCEKYARFSNGEVRAARA